MKRLAPLLLAALLCQGCAVVNTTANVIGATASVIGATAAVAGAVLP